MVAERAGYRCEYCRVLEEDMFFVYQVEHIISRKHGGATELSNLAYACSICNPNKGTDLGTILPGSLRLIRLFHPRKDKWQNHFEVENGEILPKTKIGAATVKVLDLNHPDRIILRRVLEQAGRYP
ncbi:MAG: HNH endonuclease [Bacteroidota bacterium]